LERNDYYFYAKNTHLELSNEPC